MDATRRAQLVDRITTTWPNGPKGVIWTEALTDHDEITFAQALEVYKHLRDTVERNNPPSVAWFLATWRARHQHATPDTGHTTGTDGPTMSFAEYLSRLTWRASTGDSEAAGMLAMWEQNLQRMPKGWTPGASWSA